MSTSPDRDPKDTLESAAQSARSGLLAEYVDFLKTSKRWWLVPILVAIALLGVLVLLASTGAAPFIYTLF